MRKSIGLVIVGDEILSGRRQDKHLGHIIQMLAERSLSLAWCRIIGDDMQQQVALYRDTLASDQIVFSTGGIGATPDDLTREAAALASGFALETHPEGLKIIEAHFAERMNDNRRRLVEFPRSSQLIPNPVNNVPGFSVYDHHFVPGFPQMAWPMLQWVLDNYYQNLAANRLHEQALLVEALEGQLIPLMENINKNYTDVTAFSLPRIKDNFDKRECVLGVKGVADQVELAIEFMQKELDQLQISWHLEK